MSSPKKGTPRKWVKKRNKLLQKKNTTTPKQTNGKDSSFLHPFSGILFRAKIPVITIVAACHACGDQRHFAKGNRNEDQIIAFLHDLYCSNCHTHRDFVVVRESKLEYMT